MTELQNALEQILDQNDVNFENDFQIIAEAIKADFYGFDYKIKPKSWRSSFGEVIHSQINNINPISVYRKIELEGDKNSLLNKLRSIFWTNYKLIGSYKDVLPEWLGYEMFDNLMLLSGIPKKQHQGEYKILIYNQEGYVSQSRDFMIKSKSKKQNLEKSLFQDSPSQNKKKNEDNQMNFGQHMYSSFQSNLNYMNDKANFGSPMHIIRQRISQYQKPNSKGMFTKLNTEENVNLFQTKQNIISELNNNNPYVSLEILEQPQATDHQKDYESINSLNSNQFNENGQFQSKQIQVSQTSQLKLPNHPILPYLLSPPISLNNRENLSIFHSQNNLRKVSNQEKSNGS